jgi:hypothetical protein
MKRNVYLLVFFTFWAQFDDVLVDCACAFQSDSLASDDDDECLPLNRKEGQEQVSVRRPAHPVGALPQTEEFRVVGNRVLIASNLTKPFAPPPLYFFMSMQV